MIDQNLFFTKYNIDEEKFKQTGLKWDDLLDIYKDYLIFKEELEPSATYVFNAIMKFPFVHSVRYRIKDPEHLIEKIIRKKIDNDISNVNIENYKESITDLIGLRALHLFKEDWEKIHDSILGTWSLKQPATANYRKGDAENLIEVFRNKNCEVNEHKFGYRSIHYLIETKPAKIKFYVEIQVRTIFEEAWSEIDHTIRYPYDLTNPIFSQYLSILNRLSGGADEMGSFVKFLKTELSNRENEYQKKIEEKNDIIKNLEENISKLKINSKDKIALKENLNKLINQEKVKPNHYSSLIEAYLKSQDRNHTLASIGEKIFQFSERQKLIDDLKNIKK